MNAIDHINTRSNLTGESVYTLFARQAEKTPHAVAVITEHESISYHELAKRTGEISAFLRGKGLAPEQPVAVLLERGKDLLSVLLGIWKAGGAYVPIDPLEPAVRVKRLMELSDSKILLGNVKLLDKVRPGAHSDGGAEFVNVEDIIGGNTPADASPDAPGGSNLAYLLFTSGSTGEPKAVEVEHGSVVNLIAAARDLTQFTASDRYLAVATIGFDTSVAELFVPLTTGGSILLRDRKLLLEPKRLVKEIREFGVTFFQTSPSAWSTILADVPNFPKVKVAITTGEPITPGLALKLLPLGEAVWNLYGPTETTVWATAYRLTGEKVDEAYYSAQSAPIGTAMAGLTAIIADEKGLPVSDGTRGELYICGIGVARGYRGREELTSQRFIKLDGVRAYKTGDVVMRDAAGIIHYFGRNDDQLKIRGIRIEPAEIEAVISRHPKVAQVALTWFETQPGSKGLVAAIVTNPGVASTPQEMRAFLERELPARMIPARFLFVPWLPSTNSGKVDKQAIRKAVTEAPAEGQSATPSRPLTSTERIVAGVWQRMMHLETVSPGDHFFASGGDSLGAVHMLVEIESMVGFPLPMNLILDTPTLEGFAKQIDQLKGQTSRPDVSRGQGYIFPIIKMERGTPLFFNSFDLGIVSTWNAPCPVYEIARWIKGKGFVKANRLEELAAFYIDEMRRIQPSGPYRIGGYSFGGLIAFEMAHQLEARGEEVDFIFLLDPPEPFHSEGTIADWDTQPFRATLPQRIKRHIGKAIAGPGQRGVLAWLSELLPVSKVPSFGWAVYQLLDFYGKHPNPISRSLVMRDRWPAFRYAARRLMKNYVARPYRGRSLSVFVRDSRLSEVWAPLLGTKSEKIVLEAEHTTLFNEPALSQWTAWLTDSIRPR